jgi:hypothetical protein
MKLVDANFSFLLADGDELENIEIAEQQARQDAYKAAKKKPGSYEDKYAPLQTFKLVRDDVLVLKKPLKFSEPFSRP